MQSRFTADAPPQSKSALAPRKPESVADLRDAAHRLRREQFVAVYPFAFLVGKNALAPAHGSDTAEPMPRGIDGALPTRVVRPGGDPPTVQVFLVRKIQTAFESMITVGRSRNNDLALDDVEVSKFHAYFRKSVDGALELVDADSTNGTWIGHQRLPKHGSGVVHPGDRLQFASLAFELL